MDKPESGKIYRLTGGPDTASISRGDTWAASMVDDLNTHYETAARVNGDPTPVRLDSLTRGEYLRRKADSKKTYTRGEYVRDDGLNRYACDDCDDISRSIYLKGSTMVFVGFTY